MSTTSRALLCSFSCMSTGIPRPSSTTVVELSGLMVSLYQWRSRRSFVDRIVDHLIHKVVQAFFRNIADIHRRTLSHGLKAFEHLNITGIVFLFIFCHINIFYGGFKSLFGHYKVTNFFSHTENIMSFANFTPSKKQREHNKKRSGHVINNKLQSA